MEPVLIRRLKGCLGCELLLYGRASVYRLRVSLHTSPAQIELHALALDSIESGPGSLILSGCDEPQSWHRVTDLMVWREGVAGSDELDEWQEISDQLRESNDWWSWK